MRTIYIDSENKCHTINDGTMTAIEVKYFFDEKCDAYIEGFCYEIRDNSTAIYAWKPFQELAIVQHEYERAQLIQYKVELAELDAALLDAQYQNLIGGL